MSLFRWSSWPRDLRAGLVGFFIAGGIAAGVIVWSERERLAIEEENLIMSHKLRERLEEERVAAAKAFILLLDADDAKTDQKKRDRLSEWIGKFSRGYLWSAEGKQYSRELFIRSLELTLPPGTKLDPETLEPIQKD